MAEHQKEFDTLLFLFTYASKVYGQGAKIVPPFSLETTPLRRRPTAIALPMPADVSDNDLPSDYTLRLVNRAALLRKIVDTNSKKAKALFKKNNDKHVRFEAGFATGGYVLVERPPFLVPAAVGIA